MSRIPETSSAPEQDGVPGVDQIFDDQGAADSVGGIDVGDREARASLDWGTTAREEMEGEPLDLRLSREESDPALDGLDLVEGAASSPNEAQYADTPGAELAGQGVGRLVDSDQGGGPDTEAELTATDVGTDVGGWSAEESAMHVVPEV